MTETIETTWGKVGKILAKKGRLAVTRKIKVVIRHLADQDVVTLKEMAHRKRTSKNRNSAQALKRLDKWIDSHTPLVHEADDSRESIYKEIIRDTR